jgi:glycerol-3-phosphate dehydrogenase (NAD(P)+)
MKIAILGIGAYGIALANVFCKNKNEVVMWSKYEEETKSVLLNRENTNVLPGIKIPEEIQIITDLKKTVDNANVIILAVPTKAVRAVSKELLKYLTNKQIICIVSKGIEEETNKLMSEVVFEETGSENICMLSGPSFAIELAKNVETGLIIAGEKEENTKVIQKSLENDNVIVKLSDDIIGMQISSAIKNVFAILMGMLAGMNKSDSTQAAVLTCLVRDLKTIINILGGREETIFSYASIGDMLLTCMSSKSRNYRFGYNIGKGLNIEEAFEEMKITTVEGLYTLKSIMKILEGKQVEIKSIKLLNEVIYEKKKINNILAYIN